MALDPSAMNGKRLASVYTARRGTVIWLSRLVGYGLSLLTMLLLATPHQLCNSRYVDNLTYDDLALVVGPAPVLLVFMVDWCEHCAALVSELRVLADAANRAGDAITVALVDAEREPAIALKFHVNGYPTLLFAKKGFSLKEHDIADEYTDYHWAELVAEFVNNSTGSLLLEVPARQGYLSWRRRVPYNRGSVPSLGRSVRPQIRAEPEKSDDDGLPWPKTLNAKSFENVALNPDMFVMILFYTNEDVFTKETAMNWRQASFAYNVVEDGVMVAWMDVGTWQDNARLMQKYANAAETPAAVLFLKCQKHETEASRCNRFRVCPRGQCLTTRDILHFVSTNILENHELDTDNVEEGQSTQIDLGEVRENDLPPEDKERVKRVKFGSKDEL